MDYFIVALTTLLLSALTFFSGFGLGTLLLPLFLILFPVDIAIAATAIVHLINNIFKALLIGRKANYKVLWMFGIPAAVFAIIGAFMLSYVTYLPSIWQYSVMNRSFLITPIKLLIAVVMITFAGLELSTRFEKWSFPEKYVPLGGALSGFFGGLSGYQGALRSAFLIRSGLKKEAYIGTTVLASIMVDIARLVVYGFVFFARDFAILLQQNRAGLILTGIIAALLGSALGFRFIKKVTIRMIRSLIGALLLVYGLALGLGII